MQNHTKTDQSTFAPPIQDVLLSDSTKLPRTRGIGSNSPGNPYAKQKIVSITKLIRDYTLHHPSKAHKLVAKLYDLAIKGNVMAINMILERMDGKVTDKIEMDIKPVNLVFVPAEQLLAQKQALELPLGETIKDEGLLSTPKDGPDTQESNEIVDNNLGQVDITGSSEPR